MDTRLLLGREVSPSAYAVSKCGTEQHFSQTAQAATSFPTDLDM